jgi:thiamine biosynthesis lipoprotein
VKRIVAAALALALTLVPLAFPCEAFAEEVKESYSIFGALLDIRVEAVDRETAQNRIRDAVTVAHRLETLLATDDPSSELARLNASAGRGPMRVSLDLYRILALSRLMTRSTGDAFDVTVGPLVRRRAAAADRSARIDMDKALSLVGADGIVLSPPDEASLADAGMSVDLAAIRRGYCLERMAATLRDAGVEKALLEFGDSTAVAVGPPDEEPPFRVRVARGRSVAGSVELRDLAMSTTRARQRDDDAGYAPIVDPRSGRLVDSERQATVLARDAAIAEAWSTALVVDPDGALGLLEEPRDVEAIVFDEHGEHWSPRFASFAKWKPSEAGVLVDEAVQRGAGADAAAGRQAERAARRDERAAERADAEEIGAVSPKEREQTGDLPLGRDDRGQSAAPGPAGNSGEPARDRRGEGSVESPDQRRPQQDQAP